MIELANYDLGMSIKKMRKECDEGNSSLAGRQDSQLHNTSVQYPSYGDLVQLLRLALPYPYIQDYAILGEC